MNSFTVLAVLAIALLASVRAEEAETEVKDDLAKKPAHEGHGFQFNANTEGRRVGLEKLRELMKKNLGLKPKQDTDNEDREKRGILSHHQPIHQVGPIHQVQPVYHQYGQPDYVVEYTEYCYEPQPNYCY